MNEDKALLSQSLRRLRKRVRVPCRNRERVLVDCLIDPIPARRVGAAVTVWFHANAPLAYDEERNGYMFSP